MIWTTLLVVWAFFGGFFKVLGFIFFAIIVIAMTRKDVALDQTAKGGNFIFALWAIMVHRAKMFLYIALEDNNGNLVKIEDGMKVTVGYEEDGTTPIRYNVRRPFGFFERDLGETFGFRKDNKKPS